MKNRILILSPHTDDAELGCGGSIVRFIEEKREILWVVFSTAEESLPINWPQNTLEHEFINVYRSIGIESKNVNIHHFKVRHLTSHRQDVLEELYKLKKYFQPELVIGPSLNDYHQDHGVVANEMIRAFKGSSSIISYELPWNHIKFDTQMFIKLDENQILAKIEMLQFYKSQFEKNRHYFSDEFLKGLARTRGAQIGIKYAEAFEVIRWIY